MDKISKKNKMIIKKIKKLKKLISNYNLDGYIIPKNDAYFAEYSFPNRLKTISNFSGSAGFAIILNNESYLFVDGRYTLQAKIESGKYFKIIEIPKLWPKDILKKYKRKLSIGFDPQLFTNRTLINQFNFICNLLPIKENLIDQIYKEKNKDYVSYYYNLSNKIAGESINSKINRLLKKIKSKNIDNIFISAPENVAWLLNLRGKDSPFSPIPNCKIILTKSKKIYFFSCPLKIKNIKKIIPYNKFKFYEYKDFSKIISNLPGKSFCIDNLTCSSFNESIIKSSFDVKSFIDPCYEMKSIKNLEEIKNMKNAHIKDGLALTRFIYWIKNNNHKNLTEISAQNKLEKFRKLSKEYIFPSFNTIAGSGPNGAIIHYRASKSSNRKISKKDIFLCDSGGQYKFGTTDVTRTLCFFKQPSSIKDKFTKVLKGHIAVATSDINKLKNGKQIDIKARQFLKKDGLDYSHGTGHGVGFFLNVHEGPQSISKFNTVKLKEGMILSNEPGFYKKNHYGIRIENLVFIKKINNKLKFENLTLAPIENELVNFKMLNKAEKNYLFEYHLKIYSEYSKYLNKKEKKWLASLI
tara:strand:+ start:160 stop:1899 length:1740 start_codon:yes stop_codon:yes gene_type:complete